MYNGADTDLLIHVTVAPTDASGNPVGGTASLIRNGTYHDLRSGQLTDISLQSTTTVRDFLITTWVDLDQDGSIDSGEDSRKIRVHLVTVDSLTVTDYDDTTDTVTTNDSTIPSSSARRTPAGRCISASR